MTWPCRAIGSEPNTFVEVDDEIFSIVILLLSVIQEWVLSVNAKVCAQSTA